MASVYQQHVEQQQGKPLEQLSWGTRAKGENLMQDISLEMVKQRLNQWLASQKEQCNG